MKLNKKKIFYLIGIVIICYMAINSLIIYNYSFTYSENKYDVAIVLGAGTNNGEVSPIFRERINHCIFLYKKGIVNKIILTGGYGKGQKKSDSQVAKNYALNKGIPNNDILIEEVSKFTIENLEESKNIMDSLGLQTALIISDPIHMKRSIELAKKINIDCKPSPTKTSMYKSTVIKMKALFYETFFYSLGQILRKN